MHRTVISVEIAVLFCLLAGVVICINFFTEVNLGEIDFGKINFGIIDYPLWRRRMQDIFRGRTAELRILDKKFKQSGFVMTVLYGRRRIGELPMLKSTGNSHYTLLFK